MKRLHRIATISAPLAFLNAAVPLRSISIHRDISYGVHKRHKLDIYVPHEHAEHMPVTIFYFGGKWRRGDKCDYVFAAQSLAAHGVVCVLPNYRLYPDVEYPEFIEDGAAALRWVAAEIADYGGNPDNLFTVGHSAGAYIAAMLALGGPKPWPGIPPLRGFIGLAGPYDFLPMTDPEVIDVFGELATSKNTQPIQYVHSDTPPALLLAGSDDRVVGAGNAVRLGRALTKAGAIAEAYICPNLTHVGTILALAPPFRRRAPVLSKMLGFIRQYSRMSA